MNPTRSYAAAGSRGDRPLRVVIVRIGAVGGRMAAAEVFAGPAVPRERPAAWLYQQKIRWNATHVVEQGCELLGAAVGEALRPAKVALPVDPVAEAWCDSLLGSGGERF